jgi:hypothetical protein
MIPADFTRVPSARIVPACLTNCDAAMRASLEGNLRLARGIAGGVGRITRIRELPSCQQRTECSRITWYNKVIPSEVLQ